MVKVTAAVVTASDTRSIEDDVSGRRLVDLLGAFGADVVEHLVLSDDLDGLRNMIYTLTEREEINLILTTGGTGLGPRDNTPEATRSVIDREAPGIAEAMRRETSVKTAMAMLSRGIAGTRNRTLIVNVPGSTKGVEQCFEILRPILQHAVDQVAGRTDH